MILQDPESRRCHVPYNRFPPIPPDWKPEQCFTNTAMSSGPPAVGLSALPSPEMLKMGIASEDDWFSILRP